MLSSKVGWSKAADAFSAGKEAAAKAGCSGNVAFVFGSPAYDSSKLIAGVKEALPKVPVVGCTSFTGVITPDGFIGGDTYCGIMLLDDPDMTVGTGSAEFKGCAVEAGAAAAKAALEAAARTDMPDWFYMVAPPGKEEYYLQGIQSVVGRRPFFGGSAADNDVSGKWFVYGEEAMADGVTVAFFWNKPFGKCYTGAYRKSGKRGIMTKVEGNRQLAEIDGKPALDVIASWIGSTPAELQGLNLLGATIHHPRGQQDIVSDHVWIRHPMAGNPDGSVNVGNKLIEGTCVEMMEATTDELISSVGDAVNAAKESLGSEMGALLAVHCGGRRGGIGDRIEEVTEQFKKTADGAPFIAVFTFGEYGCDNKMGYTANGCGGLMLSFMALKK